MKFKDVAHLYKGVMMKTELGIFPLVSYYKGDWWLDTIHYGAKAVEQDIKPVLRKPEDINPLEDAHACMLKRHGQTGLQGSAECILYLASIGIDLFGLIESGEAIENVFNLGEDVKTEPQAEPEPERATKEGIFEDTTHGFISAVSYLKQMDEKILTLIKPHEIIQHANRLWAKNLQAAEPAQGQEFSYDDIGYGRAIGYLVKTCKYPQVSNLGQITDINTIVAAANELWEQDNQKT